MKQAVLVKYCACLKTTLPLAMPSEYWCSVYLNVFNFKLLIVYDSSKSGEKSLNAADKRKTTA